MITQNKRLLIILFSVPLLLLIPFVAMQFTSQVDWSTLDFLVMGTLLIGTGLIGEVVWRKVKKMEHRTILLVVLIITLLLIWAELAVGIFGTPFAGS